MIEKVGAEIAQTKEISLEMNKCMTSESNIMDKAM